MKKVKFLWRMPPQINIKLLEEKNSIFKTLENNIVISSSTLKNDIQQSQYLLYRGTSIVIQSVLKGLKPIYYARERELSMDSLFNFQSNQRVVKSACDFYKKINEKNLISSKLQQHSKKLYVGLNILELEKNL
jgi:hypothetical protein